MQTPKTKAMIWLRKWRGTAPMISADSGDETDSTILDVTASRLHREMRAAYRPGRRKESGLIAQHLSDRSSERLDVNLWDATTRSFVGGDVWGPVLMRFIATAAASSYERGIGQRLTRAA